MKKTIFLFVVLIFIASKISAQPGWVLQNSGTTENLVSVYFLNDNTGFAGGESSIRMTTNGGNNWFQVLTTGGGSFYFINNLTGFVLSGNYFKTTNGGYNWNSLSTGTGSYKITQMADSLTGYGTLLTGCRGYYTPDVNMIKTTNGGLTWLNLNVSNITSMVNSFLFFDANTGVVPELYQTPPNTSYSAARTTNGGSSWTNIPGTNTFFLGLLAKINATTAYGVYNKYPTTIVTSKTIDKGASWTFTEVYVPLLNNTSISGIQFLNASTGYLATGTFSGGSRIYKTTDAGSNWMTSLNYVSINLLAAVHFPSALTGYTVGNNGTIFKTTDGGTITGFTESNSEVPTKFSLQQNSPNPFNPSTTVSYDLPVTNFVQLKIYDALGNEVETLVNEKQKAGRYSVNFNALSLPSGAYFYKLVTESFSETKKMILVK